MTDKEVTLARVNTGRQMQHMSDREYLDREYNNQAKVKNFKNYVGEWRALSATARSEIPNVKVLTYDQKSGQKLDLIFPLEGVTESLPVQVFFHGGYWKALDRELFYFVARSFADYGIATAVVDYELIPTIQMPELIRQCRESIAFLYRQSERLGLDNANIHCFGHSAGGHISAMCLATDWSQFAADLPDQILQSATGISGLYDLEPISNCFLQDDLHLSNEDVSELSPAYLDAPANGQMQIIVGSEEGPEYAKQSESLYRKWEPISLSPINMNPYNHFTIMSAFADPTSAPAQMVRQVIGSPEEGVRS
ncbi:alpha/beta hydrolase [Sneathiella glossodoripedis]|uniref:alpha/beta hydrolase n=1 Tax=Sneathiella glossodoripedis TaxID=418853 RepID=UPI000471333D|nr:alpha/beta hydrolase [Sneathiella glossodoripedis]